MQNNAASPILLGLDFYINKINPVKKTHFSPLYRFTKIDEGVLGAVDWSPY